MVINTYNSKKELIATETNNKIIISKLASELFRKFMNNAKDLRIKHINNYTNLQTIEIRYDNGIREVYEDIPMQLGQLWTAEIINQLQ